MAQPVDTQTRTPSGPLPDQWPTQAADGIVRVVGQVRDRTAGPAVTVARAVVYGILAAVVGVLAAVLASVLLVRLIDTYLPGKIWIVYFLLGGLFALGGLLLWRKAFSPPAPPA